MAPEAAQRADRAALRLVVACAQAIQILLSIPQNQTQNRSHPHAAEQQLVQVLRLVTASVDRMGAAAEAAQRFDRAALAVLRLVAACAQAAGGSHAVHAEAAAFLDLHAQGLLRILHNAGSGVHRSAASVARCWTQ